MILPIFDLKTVFLRIQKQVSKFILNDFSVKLSKHEDHIAGLLNPRRVFSYPQAVSRVEKQRFNPLKNEPKISMKWQLQPVFIEAQLQS